MKQLVFFSFIAFVAPLVSHARGEAVLSVVPSAGSFLVGSTFDVSFLLDTKNVAINTVEIELDFPADKIQLTNPTLGRSIIQLWPAPPTFSNREGRVYFVGGIPSPGITTSQGLVFTLTFRVVAPGKGELRFGEKTSLLANDGKGTNILGNALPAFFTFLVPPPQGPTISSPTHSDQEQWYQNPSPTFIWPQSAFGNAYSYAIDQNPTGFPDTIAEGSDTTASFENLKNGIRYFHLRERAGGVWGGISHFVVRIDNELPSAFSVAVSPAKRMQNRNPVFRFFTTDILSGLDHFSMKIVALSRDSAQETFFFEVSSPYQALNLDPGRYQVIVRATDKAGNNRDEAVTLSIVTAFSGIFTREGIDFMFFFLPWSGIASRSAFILLVLFIILFLFGHRHHHSLVYAIQHDIKKFFHFLS